MRFTERAFFLPDDSVMSWVPSQPDYPPWRRPHWRRQDRGLHPLEHVLQELAMLEYNPWRRSSHARQNMPEHQGYNAHHRTGCLRLKDRCYPSSCWQGVPGGRRYSPYQAQHAGCPQTVRRLTVQDPQKGSEGPAGRLIPHTDQAQWHTSFDMSGFKPCNINVKVENGTVHLSAKREERYGSGFSMSEASRRERLPDDVDVGSVTAWLNDSGVMHVTANRRTQPPEALQADREELPQTEGSGPTVTAAATDLVVQVGSDEDRNVHVAVEDPKANSTGQRGNDSGEVEESPNAISSCGGTQVGDDAQKKSIDTDSDSSPTRREDFLDEPSKKAEEEDANPEDDDIIVIHDATSATPGAAGTPGSPKRADAPANSDEVMVIDDKAADQETTPHVEDQTPHEDPSSQQDKDMTLVETPATNTTDTPFGVTLNMSTYDPEDLRVRVSGRQVHVTAERAMRHPDGSTMCRRYNKSFSLPESVDADSVTSVVTTDGQLTVTATSRQPETEYREVAIQKVEN